MEKLVAIFLQHWLKGKAPGETGINFTFDRQEISSIPLNHYAAVRVELIKLGGEPKEYEKCKCGEMHEKGTECPYSR